MFLVEREIKISMIFKTDTDAWFNISSNYGSYELSVSGFWFPLGIDSNRNFYVIWHHFPDNIDFIDSSIRNYIDKFVQKFGNLIAFA